MLDVSQEGIIKAIEKKAGMIIVHHGLFWSDIKCLTGINHERVKLLIESDVALYAIHLPLDMHREIGNNIAVLNRLGLKSREKFGLYHGSEIGLVAKTRTTITDFCRNVQKNINKDIRTALFGPREVKRVAVVSGGGADLILDVKRIGADTFLTGESKLHAYHLAKELGINVIFAGHYATEVPGIKLLSEFLPEKLDVETVFIDIPTIF
jgi:dinuclear metal center YbgI/SA1388 family protein